MQRIIFLILLTIALTFGCSTDNKSTSAAKTVAAKDSVQISTEQNQAVNQYTGQPHTTTISDYDYTAPYICPNHCPGSGSDKPGKCPVCGMDLIPNPDYQQDTTNN